MKTQREQRREFADRIEHLAVDRRAAVEIASVARVEINRKVRAILGELVRVLGTPAEARRLAEMAGGTTNRKERNTTP